MGEGPLQRTWQRIDVHLEPYAQGRGRRNAGADAAVGGAGEGQVQAYAVTPERLIAEGREAECLAALAYLPERVRFGGEVPLKTGGSRDVAEQGGCGRPDEFRMHDPRPL